MSGVRSGTRLEQLRDLRRRTHIQHAYAQRHGLPTDRHRELLAALDAEIAREDPGHASVVHQRRRPAPGRAETLLTVLGVTSHDVKVWAVEQGLLDQVRRGRIAYSLVETYATHAHITALLDSGYAQRKATP